jgi:exonuclease III
LEDLWTYLAQKKTTLFGEQWTFWSTRGNTKEVTPEWPYGKGWRLDYVFVKNPSFTGMTVLRNFVENDHAPIVVW